MSDAVAHSIDRLQREVWREERDALGLLPGTPDFGKRGLMTRLNGPALQVVLLPSDPQALSLDFDDALARELPDRFEGTISNSVQLLGTEGTGSQHMLKIASGDEKGARALLALARHGGISVGMAERHVAYRLGEARVVRLCAVSGAVRLALKAQHAALRALADLNRWTPDRPWELTVALPGATGSYLGGFAEGWRETEHLDSPPLCVEPDPVVRVELPVLPRDVRDRDEVLLTALGRTVNAFGTTNPFHLNARNTAGGVPHDF